MQFIFVLIIVIAMTTSRDPASEPAVVIASELRELVGRLKQRLRRESGNHGLSLSQMAALGRLYRCDTATVSDLARAQNVRSQSMGHAVAHLQSAGLVESRADPEDGRRTLLSLTPLGRERVETIRAARDGWLYRTIEDRFDREEQLILAQAVQLLSRLTED